MKQLKILIFRLATGIYHNYKLAIKAHYLQFQSLQKVEDLRMHYAIGHFEYYGQ